MTYLGICITKHVQDLCTENYKTLVREVQDPSKRRAVLCVD